MPGSLESSAARSSIAPTLERELEGKIQTASELPHLSLSEVRRFFLRFVYRDKDEIFEHLDILRVSDARVDLDPRDRALPVGVDGNHASACGGGDGLLFQIRLHLLHARLHLLRLLEDLAEISHLLVNQ